MKKSHLMIALLYILSGWGCGGTTTKDGHLSDSVIADSPQINPQHMGDRPADSPALGTDNIRMDSMNNSSR